MSDQFVTVMTFNRSFEAQLAKNLLENEGIESMLAGELTADVLPFGQAGGSDQIALQVREDDAQRAAGLLAAVDAAKLDDDWEDQAESGVWLCSICGEPVSNRLSICYSCQTPREGIRAGAPRSHRHPARPRHGAQRRRSPEARRDRSCSVGRPDRTACSTTSGTRRRGDRRTLGDGLFRRRSRPACVSRFGAGSGNARSSAPRLVLLASRRIFGRGNEPPRAFAS